MKNYKRINFERCHQKKNKKCPYCENIIWQSSKQCKSCSTKNSTKNRGEDYRAKMSKIAKERGFGLWMTGKKATLETKLKLSNSMMGKNSKGEDIGYSAIHMWIASKKKKINLCEYCKKKGKTDYANKSHKYKKDVNDWLELCRKCHVLYDKNFRGFAKIRFGNLKRRSYA